MSKITDSLFREYVYNNDVCLAEFLAWKKVRSMDRFNSDEDLSFEDAFELYIAMMSKYEDDRFFVMKEGELYELEYDEETDKVKMVEREIGIH